MQPLLDAIRNETNLSPVVKMVFSLFAVFVKDFATPEEFSQWEIPSSTWQKSYPAQLADTFKAAIRPINNEYIQFRSSIADLIAPCSALLAVFQETRLTHESISAMNRLQDASRDLSVREMVTIRDSRTLAYV
jgi:hypothetical protein